MRERRGEESELRGKTDGESRFERCSALWETDELSLEWTGALGEGAKGETEWRERENLREIRNSSVAEGWILSLNLCISIEDRPLFEGSNYRVQEATKKKATTS